MLPAAILLAHSLACLSFEPPFNLGFEDGEAGRPPVGWEVRETSVTQGFQIRVVSDAAVHGARCLEIARREAKTFGQYGAVRQEVPAQKFRGKRIRFSAMIRTSGLNGYTGAGLVARVVRPDFRPGHCSELNASLERGKEWTRRSVVVDVADDALRVEIGFTLTMEGTACFDDAKLEVIGTAGDGNEPPRPFTPRGLGNIQAFAKMLAYIRFFHPSDEAAAADWDRFAVGHASYIEQAESAADLAARLMEVFAPYAPTLQLQADGQADRMPVKATPNLGDDVRVIAWRHVGADPNRMFGRQRHDRVVDRSAPYTTSFKVSPAPLPKPTDAYEADLGGGVQCRFPTSLHLDAKGTVPRATAKPKRLDKSSDFPPTGDDRATRIAGVCLAWGMFQHFYPYFEETKADWPSALTEALKSAATDRDGVEFNRTVRRLIARLQDSHGAVRPGSGAIRCDAALPFSWDVVEGKLAVTWVDPAAGLRVKPGDVATSINGKTVEKVLEESGPLASGATEEHRRYRTCAELRIGPAGQPVAIAFKTPTGEPYSINVKRMPADDSPLRGPSMREPRLQKVERLSKGVMYVDLDRCNEKDLFAAFQQIRSAEGVVFDLRGYPATSLWFLRMFADKPWIQDRYGEVTTLAPDRRVVKLQMKSPPPAPPLPPRMEAKVAFITDGRAVSYAETLLAIVDNTKIGTIVGEPTAGSNGGVFLYTLPDGTRVSWTGQKAIRADGSRLHGIGVRPAVFVKRSLAGLAAGRDEALERAVEITKASR
jgi:C-terminal processing protease CtpA/Prc